MANNNIWLVHRPTGRAVKLGKRYGSGWFRPPSKERMMEFFDSLDEEEFESMDDLVLCMEDGTDAPGRLVSGWRYAPHTYEAPLIEFEPHPVRESE